ncbi:MAG: SCP2 sterol-binding domain-containing protein, partial [Promethearchaeota archaeon]
YWLKASEGRVEYGEGTINKPFFTITASKDILMGLFLGELDANIVSSTGKLKAVGNFKNLRAFQEFYEDAIEEFKKRY